MKKIRKIICCLLLMTWVLCLFGCGSDKNAHNGAESEYEEIDEGELAESYSSNMDRIYKNAIERVTNQGEIEEMEGTDIFDKLLRKFLGGYRRGYLLFKEMSTTICICSIVTGGLMVLLSRKNKRIKRTGLYVFILGIPALTIISVVVIGIANGFFLY